MGTLVRLIAVLCAIDRTPNKHLISIRHFSKKISPFYEIKYTTPVQYVSVIVSNKTYCIVVIIIITIIFNHFVRF